MNHRMTIVATDSHIGLQIDSRGPGFTNRLIEIYLYKPFPQLPVLTLEVESTGHTHHTMYCNRHTAIKKRRENFGGNAKVGFSSMNLQF